MHNYTNLKYLHLLPFPCIIRLCLPHDFATETFCYFYGRVGFHQQLQAETLKSKQLLQRVKVQYTYSLHLSL